MTTDPHRAKIHPDRKRSSRRLAITLVLLALAAAGGIVRQLAPNPSVMRDMGSLLLVLWLPIIGNIIAWLVARFHARKPQPQGFEPARPFTATSRIELTLMAAAVPAASRPIRAGLFPCAIVLGTEGFSARLDVPADGEPVPEMPVEMVVEFLRPDLAAQKLPPGTQVLLLSGRTLLGRALVLSHLMARDAQD